MTASWGADDAPPPRQSCQCDICDGGSIDHQIRAEASARVHDSYRCAIKPESCEECQEVMSDIDPMALREDEGCDLVGYPHRVREWARRYQHVDSGWIDPMSAPMPILEVAEIGDEVTSRAEQDELEAAEDGG